MNLKKLTISILLFSLTACGGSDNANTDDGKDTPNTNLPAKPVVNLPVVNSPAEFSGDLAALLTTKAVSLSGNVVVTDTNAGEALLIAQKNINTTYGSFSISQAGAWTFTLNQSNTVVNSLDYSDKPLTEKITLTSADGSTATLNVNITGVQNSPATFSGDLTDQVTLTSGITSGKATVNDLDSGEALFKTTANAEFGTFSITEAGTWSYELDENNEAFLTWTDASFSTTDTITLTSVDGNTTNLIITIKGIDKIPPALYWSADPNNTTKVNDYFRRLDGGNYPQDYCAFEGDEAGVTPSSASVITDENLGKIWRLNKPKNRKRGEFARAEGDLNTFSPVEGDDVYIAWQWKIDTADSAKIDKEVTVFQWKSQSPHNQNYPLNMEYDGDLTLNAWGADYVGNTSYASRRAVLWRKAVPQDEWVSLVVRIKLNKDDFGGIVQFWFNGEQQVLDNLEPTSYLAKLSADKKTVFHRTNDGEYVYPKWGAYNKKSCEFNINAYFHDMKIGNTLTSVMPSTLTHN